MAEICSENDRQRTLKASMILSTVHWTCFALQITLLPYQCKQLELSNVQFGYLNTAMAGFQLLSTPLFSRLTKQSLRSALAVALLSDGAFLIIAAASGGFWLLMVSRAAAAVAHVPIALQTTVAGVVDPRQRTASLAKLGASAGIGFILGSASGGLGATWFGLRLPLVIAAASCFIGAAIGPPMIYAAPSAAVDDTTSNNDGSGVGVYIRLLSNRSVAVLLAAKTVAIFPALVMLTVFGAYLIDEFRVEPHANALIGVYVGIGITLCNTVGVSFLKRKSFHDRHLLIGGILALILTGLGLCVVNAYWQFFVVFTPLTVAMALIPSSTDSMLTASVSDDDHSFMFGLTWAIDTLTRIVAPLLGGYMLTDFGFASFGYMTILANIVGILIVYTSLNVVDRPHHD